MITDKGREQKLGRHGTLSAEISYESDEDDALVCECEQVSVGELKYAIRKLHADSLINLRRRTRLGMGTCQGGLCSCRAAEILRETTGKPNEVLGDLARFINERWKGMQPVAWGQTLVEAQFMAWLYRGVCGLTPDLGKSGEDATAKSDQ